MKAPSWIDPIHYNPVVQYMIRMVRYTLRHFDLRRHEPELRARRADRDGRREMDFASFAQTFPTFPLMVDTIRLTLFREAAAGTPPIRIANAILNFEQSQIGREFCDLQEAYARIRQGRALGILFPFGRIHGGWLLHDGDFPTARTPQRVTIETITGPLRLERYANVLKAIRASQWNPIEADLVPDAGAPGAARPFSPPQRLDRSWPVPPYVRRLLGRVAAADVLALLWQLQTRELRGLQCGFIERREGARYIVIPEYGISELLGWSNRSVQKAVKKLLDDGLIERKHGFVNEGNASGYTLPPQVVSAIEASLRL